MRTTLLCALLAAPLLLAGATPALGAGRVVLNEIQQGPATFVELKNVGDAPVRLFFVISK